MTISLDWAVKDGASKDMVSFLLRDMRLERNLNLLVRRSLTLTHVVLILCGLNRFTEPARM